MRSCSFLLGSCYTSCQAAPSLPAAPPTSRGYRCGKCEDTVGPRPSPHHRQQRHFKVEGADPQGERATRRDKEQLRMERGLLLKKKEHLLARLGSRGGSVSTSGTPRVYSNIWFTTLFPSLAFWRRVREHAPDLSTSRTIRNDNKNNV